MIIRDRVIFQNRHWSGRQLETFVFRRALFGNIWKDMRSRPMIFLTGPRRTGKSVLLRQVVDDLIRQKAVPPTQILFFEFGPGDTREDIWSVYDLFLKEIAAPGLPVYCFFDEIQFVHGFERVVKEFYDTGPKTKFVLTGSLSLSYKQRMEESLGGRFFHYRLFPLGFSEYLGLTGSSLVSVASSVQHEKDRFVRGHMLSELNSRFREFLAWGRLPEMVRLTPDQQKAYILSVLGQSLTQDAFNYFAIEKPQIINALFTYLRTNSGSVVSTINLARVANTTAVTLEKYLSVLELMGLVYIVYNSTKPLTRENSAKKIYVSSMFSLFESKHDFATGMGFAVESYVLERLLEKGEEVTFLRKRDKEIDFLVPKKRQAYEVKFRSDADDRWKPTVSLPGYTFQLVSLTGQAPACLF